MVTPAKKESEPLSFQKKQLVIKVAKNKSMRPKIYHEKKILQYFRTSQNPYMLNYYHSRQDDFKYS